MFLSNIYFESMRILALNEQVVYSQSLAATDTWDFKQTQPKN